VADLSQFKWREAEIMKRLLNTATGMAMATALVGGTVAAQAAAPPEPQRTLITNRRIFHGRATLSWQRASRQQ